MQNRYVGDVGTCLGDVIGWTWRSGRWAIAVAVLNNLDAVAKAIVPGSIPNHTIGVDPFITRDAANVGHSLR